MVKRKGGRGREELARVVRVYESYKEKVIFLPMFNVYEEVNSHREGRVKDEFESLRGLFTRSFARAPTRYGGQTPGFLSSSEAMPNARNLIVSFQVLVFGCRRWSWRFLSLVVAVVVVGWVVGCCSCGGCGWWRLSF